MALEDWVQNRYSIIDLVESRWTSYAQIHTHSAGTREENQLLMMIFGSVSRGTNQTGASDSCRTLFSISSPSPSPYSGQGILTQIIAPSYYFYYYVPWVSAACKKQPASQVAAGSDQWLVGHRWSRDNPAVKSEMVIGSLDTTIGGAESIVSLIISSSISGVFFIHGLQCE